ncbi:putative alpha-L-arabinofuranosidase [Aspergillus clavatus NRRL 1]|uniref:non-reducing end alpha-L-arabinofuranosidase n=1 Tax=Aspergillus clavatus (strain ATCC 1007 / CBS 513.65 / DSM 816 / NCTC 3887 / NRRL 1 / QM 1276 / 107) TaxID=344612 RepID=A1CN30_ASPCL|nr:alpha-L-arabinofuranosidase, putative [Aspergillus clavatus NRRL 1]EAW08967.1 alpha-L-arabinofuranosidase, putative [Aspergillus clavatus NRRL 1]
MRTRPCWRALEALIILGFFYGIDAQNADNIQDGRNETISTITLTVSRTGGNQSSPLLYGAMFEEMDHSGDGGIHGQLLQNNGFQGFEPGITAYKPVGGVSIIQDDLTPVSNAIISSLQVAVPFGTTGYVGFANEGYAGVPVTAATYQTSFWVMGGYSGTVTIQLVDSINGTVFATQNITVESNPQHFTFYETSLESSPAEDGKNEWQLLFDGAQVGGSFLNFGLPQLFPPTYKNRTNGLRHDVATFLEASRPRFLRFPGGNNIEGLSIADRWIWNQTIGDVVDRPGRPGNWFYPNTDALGLDEYMWWCHDMNMTPVLAVWDGKSYGGIVSGPELQPYVDDIMNELEYLTGPPNSTWGSLRAKHGREAPWSIEYVEIGNEDDLTGGCDTYPDRFTQIYNAIHSKYPNITLIASHGNPECLPAALPPGVIIDLHYYRSDDDLVAMFNQYDNVPRNQPLMVGEWGCRNTSAERGQFWTYMRGTCAEAVYMIGMERNSDVVKMSAYAPLVQNFKFTQWSPTLFGVDSSPGSLTPSTSYFVQKMFASTLGEKIVPVTSSTGFGPCYWVASRTNSTFHIKMANYQGQNQTVDVVVPETKSGTLEMISGPEYAGNLPSDVLLRPEIHNISSPYGAYSIIIPPWGVAVLAVT